jgi:hypothetical protein
MAQRLWPDEVDEVLGADQAVAFAHVTPARGVVITPLTNFALRDREAGVFSGLNSSVGMWRKLVRLRQEPRVAIAFHTRTHGFSRRPEFVLVQGRASLTAPHRRYVESDPAIHDAWQRFAGGNPSGGSLWQRWLRGWHHRVGIDVRMERVVVWPDLACHGAPVVNGVALPEALAPAQQAPAKGTSPRVDPARAARRAAGLPDVLLGWTGADGFPVIVPVEIAGSDPSGIVLDVPADIVPPGGRRAGVTAHWFARHVVGQRQRVHTGWLEAEPGATRVVYAPHTQRAYYLPPSRLAYKLGAGFVTNRGMREARRRGLV